MRLLISMRPYIPTDPSPSSPLSASARYHPAVDGDTITAANTRGRFHARVPARVCTHAGSQQRTVRVYVDASHAAAPQKCQYTGACTRAASELACTDLRRILGHVRRSKSRDDRRRKRRYSMPHLPLVNRTWPRTSPPRSQRTRTIIETDSALIREDWETIGNWRVSIAIFFCNFFGNENPI